MIANTIAKIRERYPEERFFWIAYYNDGTIFPQFDFETFKENKFSDIQQDKLIAFSWFPLDFSEKEVKIKIEPGYKLIAFKTCKKRYGVNQQLQITQSYPKEVIAYVIGRQKIGDNSDKVLIYITENGILISNKNLEII